MMGKKVIQFIAVATLSVMFTGCSLFTPEEEMKATNLAGEVKSTKTVEGTASEETILSAADFSLNLFKEANSETDNTMISPLSVYTALSMAANGANGETLKQMSNVLYNGQDMNTVNENMARLLKSLTSTKEAKLNQANSIWFRDDKEQLQVKEAFLQTNADYYDASIYSAPFDDHTLKDINTWCSDKTDGMIPTIVDQITPNTMMYLINAICFDGKWQEKYTESQICDGTFRREDGTSQNVTMMGSTEQSYIEDNQVTGFIKPYKEGYQFVALLPNEGVSLSDYINAMTGESFLELIKNAKDCEVDTQLPQFKNECTMKLKDSLINMGITDAFDGKADFTNMATVNVGPLYISEVIHKTYISVDADGTKAAAATEIGMESGSAMNTEVKRVFLDRPFVYAIVDQNTNLPVFIGTVRSINE